MNTIKKLTLWYENLKKESLNELDIFYDENVFFKDPFNEVEGIDNLRNVFVHMFKTLDNPHFVIIDTIENSEGAFLTWDFILFLKGKNLRYMGVLILSSMRIRELDIRETIGMSDKKFSQKFDM